MPKHKCLIMQSAIYEAIINNTQSPKYAVVNNQNV